MFQGAESSNPLKMPAMIPSRVGALKSDSKSFAPVVWSVPAIS